MDTQSLMSLVHAFSHGPETVTHLQMPLCILAGAQAGGWGEARGELDEAGRALKAMLN